MSEGSAGVTELVTDVTAFGCGWSSSFPAGMSRTVTSVVNSVGTAFGSDLLIVDPLAIVVSVAAATVLAYRPGTCTSGSCGYPCYHS